MTLVQKDGSAFEPVGWRGELDIIARASPDSRLPCQSR